MSELIIILILIFQVIQCRKLIFDLSGDAYEEEKNPPKRPPKWKNVCACTLSMKVCYIFFIGHTIIKY